MDGKENNNEIIPQDSNIISFGEEFDMSAFTVVDQEEEQIIEEQPEVVAQGGDPETDTSKVEGSTEGEVAAEDDENKSEEQGGEHSSPNPYSSLASVLHEQGILSSLDSDKPIASIDELITAFNSELEKREFADLTPEQRGYLDALRNGIPEKQVQEHMELMKELTTIDDSMIESNEQLRIELIKEDFINSGVSPDRAAKLAARSVELGDDVQEAKDALSSLKTKQEQTYQAQIEQAKQAKLEQQKEFEKSLNELKKTVEKTEEIIPGFKISEKQRSQLFEQMTKPVGQVGNQPINAFQKARMEDPMGFEIKINYLFQLTKGFTDFSNVVKTSKSKAIQQLDQAIKNGTFQSVGGSGNVGTEIEQGNKDNPFSNIGEIL